VPFGFGDAGLFAAGRYNFWVYGCRLSGAEEPPTSDAILMLLHGEEKHILPLYFSMY
jgi:hypothetical protein